MADSDSIATNVGYAEQLENFPCHFVWRLEDKFNRDFKTAMEYIDHHLAQNPDEMTVPAMAVKAYLYMSNLKDNNLKDPQAALELIKKALDRNENDLKEDTSHDGPIGYKVVLLADQAWVYFKLCDTKKVEELIVDLEEIHESLSREAGAYLKAIKAFTFQWFSISKFLEGIECYKEAVSIFPSNVDWLFGYTRLLEKRSYLTTQNVSDISEINLRQILTLNPKHGLARAFLAKELADKGIRSHLEAEYEANQALDIGGNDFVVVQRVGKVFLTLGKHDRALELFQKALDSEPNSNFTLRLIGDVYRAKYFNLAKEDAQCEVYLKNAIEYYERAIEADSSNFDAKIRKADLHSRLGQTSKAEREYLQLIEAENADNKASALYNFGLFLEYQDENNAIQRYKEAIKTDPNSFGGRNAVTKIIEKMQRRVSRDKEDYEALDMLGWVYSKTGYIDSACFHYEMAYRVKPSNTLTLKLAQLYVKSVNPDKAFKYLEMIRESKSDEYRRLKGKLHLALGIEYKEQGIYDQARNEFSKSACVEYNCLEGCENLAKFLQNCTEDDKYEKRWLEDWAKIVSILRREGDLIKQHKGKITGNEIINRLKALEETQKKAMMPSVRYLRDLYDKYVKLLLKPCVDEYVHVLLEARSLLDRVMSDFQSKHYPSISPKKTRCTFFYIKDREYAVEYYLHKKLEGDYSWNGFRTSFPLLFKTLVNIQPAYDFNENKMLIFLFNTVNKYKHTKSLQPGEQEDKIGGNPHRFSLQDLSDWSVIKVAEIVRQFDKHM